MVFVFSPRPFAQELSRWFATSQRTLPWRSAPDCRDPYRVLVSEVMLQQTTVAAVIPFYHRFLERFPTVADLAIAPEEDVLAQWAGLGYYSRARNLQKCARAVMERHGGSFPATVAELMNLPGVGRYTAGAVSSITFEQRSPIVDANVARVLARVLALDDDPKSAPHQAALWGAAAQIVENAQAAPSQINPALMELGALICSPRSPRCGSCPVNRHCLAYATGRQEEIPRPKVRPQPTPLHDVCACLMRESRDGQRQYFLRRRPDQERIWWRGMWELPRTSVAEGETAKAATQRLGQSLDIPWETGDKVASLKHAVTRFSIVLECYRVELAGLAPAQSTSSGWFSWEEAQSLPLPTSMRTLLKTLEGKTARANQSQLSLL